MPVNRSRWAPPCGDGADTFCGGTACLRIHGISHRREQIAPGQANTGALCGLAKPTRLRDRWRRARQASWRAHGAITAIALKRRRAGVRSPDPLAVGPPRGDKERVRGTGAGGVSLGLLALRAQKACRPLRRLGNLLPRARSVQWHPSRVSSARPLPRFHWAMAFGSLAAGKGPKWPARDLPNSGFGFELSLPRDRSVPPLDLDLLLQPERLCCFAMRAGHGVWLPARAVVQNWTCAVVLPDRMSASSRRLPFTATDLQTLVGYLAFPGALSGVRVLLLLRLSLAPEHCSDAAVFMSVHVNHGSPMDLVGFASESVCFLLDRRCWPGAERASHGGVLASAVSQRMLPG
ncbi:hypothetical protein H6P81_021726 [Aristolochia fimbriata]|uniref:Uncharacterized protein n=1 Tax=Aristolochia fimbriata TaxID=158543 RepID=A0AAV7DP36_ARIFI|nr:hypothetical protein H6P81_021726 [Aristolochia fimbriata]